MYVGTSTSTSTSSHILGGLGRRASSGNRGVSCLKEDRHRRIRKRVYFGPDGPKFIDFAAKDYERSMLRLLEEYADSKGISFNSLMKLIIHDWLEKKENMHMVQTSIEEFAKDELSVRLELLHAEFDASNPKKYPNWQACLEGEGILTEEVVAYSNRRGWTKSVQPRPTRKMDPRDIEWFMESRHWSKDEAIAHLKSAGYAE